MSKEDLYGRTIDFSSSNSVAHARYFSYLIDKKCALDSKLYYWFWKYLKILNGLGYILTFLWPIFEFKYLNKKFNNLNETRSSYHWNSNYFLRHKSTVYQSRMYKIKIFVRIFHLLDKRQQSTYVEVAVTPYIDCLLIFSFLF